MDLHTFRIFITIAELGSFSQAGDKLFLTQPAVSKRIAALEHSLGARLFDRIGRRVQLTEAGRELLPRARRLLEEMSDIRRSIHNLSGRVSGTLTMGTSHHIGLHRLPPVLKAFTRHYPEVELDIRFLDSESACRAVERGSQELAVVTLPPISIPNLTLRPIWDDPLCFTVSRDHPLASHPSASLKALLEYPAVLPAPSTYTRVILEQALRKCGLQLGLGLTTNYLETLKMLAVTGLGWTLLPATMLDQDLVELRFPDVQLTRKLGIVTHAKRTLTNAADAMIETCETHADGSAAGRRT